MPRVMAADWAVYFSSYCFSYNILHNFTTDIFSYHLPMAKASILKFGFVEPIIAQDFCCFNVLLWKPPKLYPGNTFLKRDYTVFLLIFYGYLCYTYKLYEYGCEVIPCGWTCWASALTT